MRHAIGAFGLALCVALAVPAGEEDAAAQRARAAGLMRDGNWKDACDIFRKLCLDAKNAGTVAATDLHNATQCLSQLGRWNELDDLWEKTVAVHSDDWRVLFAAGLCYAQTQHDGFIVAGKFERGHHRGGGEYANSFARDRVRALQLLQQGLPLVRKEPHRDEAYGFYWQFAQTMLSSPDGAWRLQDLTDLNVLPDYEKGYRYRGERQGVPSGLAGAPCRSPR